MRMATKTSTQKRATNVSLPAHLIDEARELNINISQACEQGLEEQVRKSKREAWLEANRESLEGWNRWIEKNGLPLARYRQF